MADPQLRCLLCDLILADGTTAGQPTERCKQCGRDVLAGQKATTGESPIDLQPLAKKEPLTVIDDLPPSTLVDQPTRTPPRPAPMLEDDIPMAQVVPKRADIPTVQPRASSSPLPPSLAKKGVPANGPQKPIPPFRKAYLPDPAVRAGAPRPKIVVALSVLGCMTLLIIVCLAVIAYAILVGLNKARKVSQAAPVPTVVVRG